MKSGRIVNISYRLKRKKKYLEVGFSLFRFTHKTISPNKIWKKTKIGLFNLFYGLFIKNKTLIIIVEINVFFLSSA